MPTALFDTIKNGVMSVSAGILGAILLIVGIIIKIIDKGHVGVRMFFGNPIYVSRHLVRTGWRLRWEDCERHMLVKKSGLKLMIPGFYYVRVVDARMQILGLGTQMVCNADNRMHKVQLSAQFHRGTTSEALEASEFQSVDVRSLAFTNLQDAVICVAGSTSESGFTDMDSIAQAITDKCAPFLRDKFGLELEAILWGDKTPTDAQKNYDAIHGGLSRIADAIASRT